MSLALLRKTLLIAASSTVFGAFCSTAALAASVGVTGANVVYQDTGSADKSIEVYNSKSDTVTFELDASPTLGSNCSLSSDSEASIGVYQVDCVTSSSVTGIEINTGSGADFVTVGQYVSCASGVLFCDRDSNTMPTLPTSINTGGGMDFISMRDGSGDDSLNCGEGDDLVSDIDVGDYADTNCEEVFITVLAEACASGYTGYKYTSVTGTTGTVSEARRETVYDNCVAAGNTQNTTPQTTTTAPTSTTGPSMPTPSALKLSLSSSKSRIGRSNTFTLSVKCSAAFDGSYCKFSSATLIGSSKGLEKKVVAKAVKSSVVVEGGNSTIKLKFKLTKSAKKYFAKHAKGKRSKSALTLLSLSLSDSIDSTTTATLEKKIKLYKNF